MEKQKINLFVILITLYFISYFGYKYIIHEFVYEHCSRITWWLSPSGYYCEGMYSTYELLLFILLIVICIVIMIFIIRTYKKK